MARPARRWLRILAGVVLVVLGLAVTTVAVGAALSVRVIGSSMHPTLRDGDRVILDPFSRSPQRFDVVAVQFTEQDPLVVKRVLAVAGDQVQVDTSQQVLVRPGGVGPWLRVHNPAWRDQWTRLAAMPAVTVADGSLFLLGDNPDGSQDSRQLGMAPQRLVRGAVWLRVHPQAGRPRADLRLEALEVHG